MIERKNNLYLQSKDNTVRYVLGKYDSNPMIIFGINPSTATNENNDKTISKVEKISEYKNKDGYIMLNICPVRATKIDRGFINELDSEISNRNLKEIGDLLEEGTQIVAAWGCHINDRKFFIKELEKINKIVKSKKAKWICLAKTKYGHPRHPLYLAYNKMTFEEFDMDAYIQANI